MASVQDSSGGSGPSATRARSRGRWSSSRRRSCGAPQARIEAMRPYADTMRELIAGVGRAASVRAACRCSQQRETRRDGRDRAADRRPRPRRRVQRAGACAARSRSSARSQAEGKTVRWLAVGKKGRSTLTFRRRELDGAFVGLHRRPGVRRRAGDRAPGGRALHRGRGRPRRARLQHLRLGADAARDRAGHPADLGRHPRDGRGRARATTRSAATSSSSPSRRRSSSGCCPSTSRRRSTARCSSRPRPSRARG